MTSCVFAYVLNPGSVQANTRANFTLVASNGASALNLTTDDEIYLGLPVGTGATDLTPDLNDINTQAPPGWRFSKYASPGPYNFVISPTRNLTVAANAALVFQLNNVIINATQGSSQVALQEYIGSGDAGTAFPVLKSEAVLSIIAQAIPTTVGRKQTTTLKWTAAKAAYVTISPLNVQVDTVGQLVTTPSSDISPEAPQVTYSLTAWTPDQQFARDSVTVTISQPVINRFDPQNSPPINYNDSVTLQWDVAYAEKTTLSLPQGQVQKPATGTQTVQPKTMLQGNSNIATYTLWASGAGNPATKTVQIPFNPVAIDYFRYPAVGVTNSYEFYVTNGVGRVDQFAGYFQLTATGPNGPLVQYLGNYPALQIQVFVASASPVSAGTPVTLTWQTVHAQAWTLTANGQGVPIDAVASGTVVVTPAVTTTYILSAGEGAGNTLTSSLQVAISA
ncbi:hypothetical protein CSZ94_12095 [Janthinobacterium sp. ROICE36]|uniref:hypothetical protein n=1 Tax=Janthinobacterium sp. ROICE36 TaxID=2048670 RepID=UPI000C7F7846|nr:hypothetical protein [Janthinobacterium sp. ROICE36]PLY42114.1 hypothetical protein CSZ94_12095 [Janthinobacterium sp. ROICE36]